MAEDWEQGGVWRKSSRSGAQSNCVEACFDGVVVWLRNSKDPSPGGPVIGLQVEQWLRLLDHVHSADLSPAALGLRRLSAPQIAPQIIPSMVWSAWQTHDMPIYVSVSVIIWSQTQLPS